jgi:hypothetical protein
LKVLSYSTTIYITKAKALELTVGYQNYFDKTTDGNDKKILAAYSQQQ